MIAKNIVIRFHGHRVTLLDKNDSKTTPEGVRIWIKQGAANSLTPMAEIPDGTLETYKHSRPETLSVDWDAEEGINELPRT